MNKSLKFLSDKLCEDNSLYFGLSNLDYIDHIASRWHNDKQKNGEPEYNRWKQVEHYNDHKGKILDMACGVGTFLFQGLHRGYDVYGIEPENWKINYMDMKIDELDYPSSYKKKYLQGKGESLPFEDEMFDFITTYQTLEHVQDVNKCLDEMLRVLKKGGKLRIQAPDYDSFFEPHYFLPFFPTMNKKLAKIYLKILKRPTLGLDTLRWTTTKDILKHLKKYKNIKITDLSSLYYERKVTEIKIKYKTPIFISKIICNLTSYKNIYLARREKVINLVIIKLD